MIIWNDELYHSWGKKPKQKAREKQYNAWYYKKYKWRWLDNVNKTANKIGSFVKKELNRERDEKKKYMAIAEENLKKAAARRAAANKAGQSMSKNRSKSTGKAEDSKSDSGKGSKGSKGSKGKSSGGGKGKAGKKSKSAKSKPSRRIKKSAYKSDTDNIYKTVVNIDGTVSNTTQEKNRIIRSKRKKNARVKSITKRHRKRGKKILKKVLKKHRRS